MKIDDLLNVRHIVPEMTVKKYPPITATIDRRRLNALIRRRKKNV